MQTLQVLLQLQLHEKGVGQSRCRENMPHVRDQDIFGRYNLPWRERSRGTKEASTAEGRKQREEMMIDQPNQHY